MLGDIGRTRDGGPSDLFTDRNGASRRLRVDAGSTGFFAGREFRTFYEFSGLAAGASLYFKVTSIKDFIVQGLGLQIDDGWCKLEAFASDVIVANPASFSVALPVIGANRMAARPVDEVTGVQYVATLALKTSQASPAATFSGGTRLDVLSVRTSSATGQASTQDSAVAGERGLPAGDIYLKITNAGSGTASGILKARWEERQ